ncbi:hypothetical protein HZ326_8825 [Fusarium oxysporum f. sp. albedinis]|nr:hypothetical protein HZ326_8825 [Fusarium oxysporum f. sp. albedinis]
MRKMIVPYVHAHASATHCNDANGVNRGIYHYDLGFRNRIRTATGLHLVGRFALDQTWSMTAPTIVIA